MSEATLRTLALSVRNWIHAMFRDGGDAPRTVTRAVGTPINPYALK